MSRWLKCTSMHFNTDWNKYDDRLMKAVERGEVDKVAAVLSKKGVISTKLDVEGRSAFHLASTRGHLDCLNVFLGHNVDITATDATGKNALHLASRNGHSLCVQKLLQHNCPVGNVDLQGRTALHDAVMAGCSSSVKLLCDSGASVNAVDFDGRTPLVLATQMCHPRICQLLLERGADIAIRDKQNKTALILGCEFGCKDAVEVLLKNGADVTVVDSLGHDSMHYARLNKNADLVAMVKTQLDNVTKEKESAKLDQRRRQDLERQNESQQESLRKFHQEQRLLLDKVTTLQQQLSQEKLTVEDIHKEREQLKVLLGAKEREEGTRGLETSKVKVQLRPSTLGDYAGQSVLVKQSHSLDSDKLLQNPSASRVGWDQPETEALRRELDAVRRRQQASEDETTRLQTLLSSKNKECQELIQSRDTIQKQADQQVQELEDALGDVQKRMLDSECKVKQLQAHVVTVKEHLGGIAAEELRSQLRDVKGKYEGASAEVGRVRNRLKQSEKALEEYKSSEGQLAAEVERLSQDISAVRAERDELAEALLEMEAQLKETGTKQVATVPTVPAEKFDNMKNLLSNAVDEKERQLAELREDYDRVLEEIAELHREVDNRSSQGSVSAEEHQKLRATLEEHNASLKRRLADVTAKSQALIQEVEESEEEREILREQLDELNSRIEAEFIPIVDHEEAGRTMVKAMEELEDKLIEASERYGKAEAEIQQLQMEKSSLSEKMNGLQSASVTQQSEMDDLISQNNELMQELEMLQKKYEDRENELARVTVQSESMKQSLEGDYVPRNLHEHMKMELSAALEKAEAEMLKLETKEKEGGEELRNVKDGSDKLKEKLEKVMSEVEKDYVSVKVHEALREELTAAVSDAEGRVKEVSAMYLSAQEEMVKLNQELEAQKGELDTIQEAIQAKFIPLAAIEERERSYNAKLKDLTGKVLDMEEKCNKAKSVGERHKQDKEKLEVEMESLRMRLEAASVSSEQHKEVEVNYKGKIEDLTVKLSDLEQQHKQVTVHRNELVEQNASYMAERQNLQQRLESNVAQLENYETELRTLRDTVHETQAECKKSKEAQQEETQRASNLEKELQAHFGDQASLLQQHAQTKGTLEAEVAKLHLALREEEETNAQRADDIAALQSELLQATQALEELRGKEDQMNRLKTEKQRLEEEVADLGNKLSDLAEQCEELHLDVDQAREDESRARAERDTVQQKGQDIEREIRDLKKRYDDSLSTIGNLQQRIQTSAEQTEVKDKKITELLTDVERLKQALNGLSQLAYAGNAPNKRQTQHVDALQAQIKTLQQQLADAERQHRDVVSIYRTHLLSAAQGHMDEDVQAALLQIIRMRQEFVC